MPRRKTLRVSPSVLLYMVFSVFIEKIDSSKILFFNGMGEGSHFFAASALGEELVSRGHLVTFLVSNEFKHVSENPKLSSQFEFVVVNTKVFMTPYYAQVTNAHFEGYDLYNNNTFVAEVDEVRAQECSEAFSLITNLKDQHFDVIVFDPWWPCCTALGEALKIKKVAFNPASVNPLFLRTFGLHVNSALIAEQGTGFPQKMNLFQRIQNVLISYLNHGVDRRPHNDALASRENGLLRDLLEKNNVTSYMDGLRTADLFLSSTDPLLLPDLSETAGHVTVAGLTTKEPLPLPEDVETFMESSEEAGVIVLTFGTYVTHLPDKFVAIFREVLSKFPHKVIWQCKSGILSNLTENVKLLKWLPQNDILGHHKTRLFIYQGGNNGLYEAIYHAVPILVIPLGGDQFDVAQMIVDKGIGLKLDVTSVTVQSLHSTMRTLLANPRYQRNIKKMSTMFKDRPLSPRQKAAYWIEHIIKYGSEHLHSASRQLHDFQKNLMDIYVLILLVPCVTVIAAILIFKCIVEALFKMRGMYKSKAD